MNSIAEIFDALKNSGDALNYLISKNVIHYLLYKEEEK